MLKKGFDFNNTRLQFSATPIPDVKSLVRFELSNCCLKIALFEKLELEIHMNSARTNFWLQIMIDVKTGRISRDKTKNYD